MPGSVDIKPISEILQTMARLNERPEIRLPVNSDGSSPLALAAEDAAKRSDVRKDVAAYWDSSGPRAPTLAEAEQFAKQREAQRSTAINFWRQQLPAGNSMAEAADDAERRSAARRAAIDFWRKQS